MLFNSFILLISIGALWGGAVLVVDSAIKIAKKLGMSELVIGLTVVAIATSAPEFAVSISAAVAGQSSISVGNVVGSNIFNLGFILGIVALFSVMTISKELLYRDASVLFTGVVLLAIFFNDLKLSQIEGLILLVYLFLYILFLIKKGSSEKQEINTGEFRWKDIPLFLTGIILIISGGHFLVNSATLIAREFGVSEWIIGITIVAGGTSTPELATSIVAVSKKRYGISAGNLIGSDIFNLFGVLGLAAVIRPLQIMSNEYTSILIMTASILLLMLMMRTRWKLSKTEGIILLLTAIFRWSYDFIF
jgi:cation:H+ antiporter